ncbi:uncharacterized protein LOC142986193 isoform X2 [Anticarsia gemmatalis]|uniref:uncharacterized protein LOC142986193 isoform X2 n=1 Tax=Anticarsia gemmatalis TaxID=129554 RepID=UPI003F75E30C
MHKELEVNNNIDLSGMAETESHTPGVIRSTRDYLQVPESPAPASPDGSEDARVPSPISTLSGDDDSSTISTSRDNPREIRNRNEKMRRDRLNQSVAELAAIVPPVVAARRKIDKTTVLRLTAHYLRAHQYVFGDSIGQSAQEFTPASVMKVLSLFNGFLITVTYRGIIVVVSQNVHQYLGYTELDLLGQNLLNITHENDRAMLKDQLMPKTQNLGPNGELLIPDEPGAKCEVEEALAREKRRFIVRFRKLGQRSEPCQYVTCHVEGSLRRSDRACGGSNRCCQIVRRVRARTENPCSSGNDIVFIGIVRPTSETFINESALEGYRMEYRTRHSIDGQIIQCESRIALVTGYMTHEVSGVNAMNFMHRDDVRWVIIALREMYDQHRMFGESCYRLMTKNGQFIYMRTRGRLDVDQDSRACTSFVCTNTVVDEKEGKHLIKLMRKKFTLVVNRNSQTPAIEAPEEEIRDEVDNDDSPAPVEDPRRLEEVILHLVTNLPSPPPDDPNDDARSNTPEKSMSPTHRITIIPPNKEKIVSAIEKIYDVIKTLDKDQDTSSNREKRTVITETRHSLPAIFDSHHYQNPTQQCRIVELNSNASEDPNEVFNFGQASNSSLENYMCGNMSDNNLNTEALLDSALSPDLGYFDNSPGAYSSISSIFGSINQNPEESFNIHNMQQECEPQFQVIDPDMNFFPLPTLEEQASLLQMLPEPSTSNYTSGTKRRNDFGDEEDMQYKKKITETVRQNDETGFESPTLENFFDEALFNSQIETAINSLDSIDPSFPDLLISTDVQDILGQLESEQQQENVNDDFPDFE